MTTNQNGTTLSLGAMVEKLIDQASATANDGVAPADIAARRLEQVLARSANARLATALADLALELGPTHVTRRVQVTRHSSLRHAA